MSETEDLRERCENLESHLAHQEAAIQDLSETVGDQWKVIDALRREIANLKDRIGAIEGDVAASLPKEPPPPHF